MENKPKLLRREFLDSFGANFEADDIDLADTEDVLFRAEVVALDLIDRGLTPDEIIGPLEVALQRWTPDVIDEFNISSNVNWEFSEEIEEKLRAVIGRIILAAQGGGTLTTRITEEEYQRMHAASLLSNS